MTPEVCSFCDQARSEAVELIAGPPPFFICYACVARCERGALPDDLNALRCDFCEKPRHRVKRLHVGEKVRICDQCLELCSDIIYEQRNR